MRTLIKNRKRSRSDTAGHFKFKKLSSVRVTAFLRQAFKCFWSFSSLRSVIVVHIWANVLLCGAERKKGSRTAFFVCWTEPLADVLKHLRLAETKCTRYNLTETSIQCKFLNFKLIEKRKSCTHLCKCFAEWYRATDFIRTDYIDKLL